MLTGRTSQIVLISKGSAALFVFAKVIRVGLFLVFLALVIVRTKAIGGYTIWEAILFYMTFNLLDSLTQFFFREVYRFRTYVVKGFFDYILLMPISALFRSLFGGSDILDIILIFISIGFISFIGFHIQGITFLGIVLYLALFLNAFFIAMSFHIFVLSLGLLTTEVDNTIFLYRDLANMGRIPITIYQEPIRSILMFVIPVGILMTVPVQALIGSLSVGIALFAFMLGVGAIVFSYQFWRYALKQYSSVSS